MISFLDVVHGILTGNRSLLFGNSLFGVAKRQTMRAFFFGLSLGGASDIGIPWALVVQEDRCEQSSALKMVGLQLQSKQPRS